MTQQQPDPHAPRCLLCTTNVQHQGDVCPRCEPAYIAIGTVLIAYANKLEPVLKASPSKHIGAPMRFVPDVYFFLKELDTPVPYDDLVITHCLNVMSAPADAKNPQNYWYGHNIPSTFMASTINPGGFPRNPFSVVPIATWKPVSPTQGQQGLDDATGGGIDER